MKACLCRLFLFLPVAEISCWSLFSYTRKNAGSPLCEKLREKFILWRICEEFFVKISLFFLLFVYKQLWAPEKAQDLLRYRNQQTNQARPYRTGVFIVNSTSNLANEQWREYGDVVASESHSNLDSVCLVTFLMKSGILDMWFKSILNI